MKKILLAAVSTGVLFAATFVGMGAASAATTLVVDDDGFATAADCGASSPADSSTIQGGVVAAKTGDTVKVCPGQYNENVKVDKTITLLGPRANTAATRTVMLAKEASVTGTTADAASISLLANDIVLNGFLFQNNPGPGIYTSPGFSPGQEQRGP